MTSIFEKIPKNQRDKLNKSKQPDWTAPMLAKLTHNHFSDENWIYERKFDGERCLVFKKGNRIRLMSRNKKVINETYPELVDEFRQQKNSFMADGEIVAFDGNVTSFSRLQERMKLKDPEEAKKSNVAVYFYLFDILHLMGYDVTNVDLRSRKILLRNALEFSNKIRFTAHRNTEGEKYHKEACRKGWEGIIAKDAGSNYVHSRSGRWLKFKCVNQQEFVIGGYTEPQGERVGFGAILIGFYDNGDLKYAGKVGTGYDNETLGRLKKMFNQRERKKPPFSQEVKEKNSHWIKPELVCEITFTEWTDDNKLRHPRYLGLRRDKKAKDVVKES
ncbi:MAG: ATP-dependent DNA ligase [candidate division Zixibacteria bacterium]|nr:ATP-dependent DNA ligase [candidate division Zixibacteria bacterium]